VHAQALGQRLALAGLGGLHAMRVMAGPAAIASTQPRLPQWQRGPSWSTQMWPTSPAEPAAPRYTSPWQTMPQPMPVPILMTRKLVSERFSRQSSPSAIRLTSLSTNTGAA
jgi:hypothetical protein